MGTEAGAAGRQNGWASAADWGEGKEVAKVRERGRGRKENMHLFWGH